MGELEQPWVQREIEEAFSRRIPIRVVSVDDHPPLRVAQQVERHRWDAARADNLDRVVALVDSALGRRVSLEERLDRVLRLVERRHGVAADRRAARTVRLRKGRRALLVHLDCDPVSLERLHHLYLGYKEAGRCHRALLVCGDEPLASRTRDAVAWARGKAPLEALHLAMLLPTLDALLAGL